MGQRIGSFVIALMLLTACTTQPISSVKVFDPRNDALFNYQSDIILLDDLHTLTTQQEERFLNYLNHPHNVHTPSHELVYEYLDQFTNRFTYQENTYSASRTYDLRRGDCMSLAVLTTALANLAGVPVEYQLVDSDPVYGLSPNLAVRGVHVRTHLIDPDWQASSAQITLRKPGLLVDYFPSGRERFIANLDSGEYASRFYLNLAVETLEQGDLDKSYWMTVTALEHDPLSADALNTLAVIYRRNESFAEAERVYQFAIESLPNKLSALRNYELMLSALGRHDEAGEISFKLRELEDPSPFSWYRGARDAFEKGDLKDAEFFYEKAIELAPYMPELRYGLAQVLAKQGNYHLAQTEIEQSLENVWGSSNRQPYKAKLRWLQQKAAH